MSKPLSLLFDIRMDLQRLGRDVGEVVSTLRLWQCSSVSCKTMLLAILATSPRR
jgi:hypothetical protein